MILEGNQRGGSKDLALHLVKDENDHVEVHEIRGCASDNVMGALNEMYAVSRATKAKQFMYSLSINPPPDKNVSVADFEDAANRAEQKLDLQGQPRVMVFHEKEGRRHAHVVWSRIDTDKMKAIEMPYDHRRLQDVSRDLFLHHGWTMPKGLAKASERDPKNFTLAEWQQAKRVGKDPRQIKAAIQDAWAISDNKASFCHALEERGYTLAQGDKKGVTVAVDIFGEAYSITRQAKIRKKQVTDRVGDVEDLPTVTHARRKIADGLLPVLEGFKLQLEEKERKQMELSKQERQDLGNRQRTERTAFTDKLTVRQKREAKERQDRYRKGFQGLWDRVNGTHNVSPRKIPNKRGKQENGIKKP